MSDTKFASFVKEKKLDPRRILIASKGLEALQPEDRAIRLAKRKGKEGGGEGEEKKAEAETRKSRSGRPVTQRSLDAALKGGKISGPIKHRLVRAVNKLLEQKKQPQIDLRALF